MTITIREAGPEDATALIAYIQAIADEPDTNIGLSPGEFNPSLEEEIAHLEQYAAADNCLHLIALDGDKIIGSLNWGGNQRLAFRHVVHLGISVAEDWRGKGVGNQLLAAGIAWAEANPAIRRLTLEVAARNTAAIALYRKFGFEEEGILRGAFFRNGQDWDVLVMGRRA